MIDPQKIKKIGAVLHDPAAPMKARYRALFTLKGIGGKQAIDTIASAFSDESSLLKHELAYCLGQMQDHHSLDILRSVVEDENQDAIVRHEAGEALGAIGNVEDLPLLEKYASCDTVELAETCQISADRIRWLQANSESNITSSNPFDSVDPAPPMEGDLTVAALTVQLLDEDLSLFQRYRAMFSLRNQRTEGSVLALTSGFKAKSALFRHEVAYVLGQLAHEASEGALTSRLVDEKEHSMVRHECAEALGSIATDTCTQTLKRFLSDTERIVRESCEVALDMVEYEIGNDFQYANALENS